MKVVFYERVIADIAPIHAHIAVANPAAAQRVEDMIRLTSDGLADSPYASVATDQPGIRRMPLVRYPYPMFFRINELAGQVEIARVIHASRIASLSQLPE